MSLDKALHPYRAMKRYCSVEINCILFFVQLCYVFARFQEAQSIEYFTDKQHFGGKRGLALH